MKEIKMENKQSNSPPDKRSVNTEQDILTIGNEKTNRTKLEEN